MITGGVCNKQPGVPSLRRCSGPGWDGPQTTQQDLVCCFLTDVGASKRCELSPSLPPRNSSRPSAVSFADTEEPWGGTWGTQRPEDKMPTWRRPGSCRVNSVLELFPPFIQTGENPAPAPHFTLRGIFLTQNLKNPSNLDPDPYEFGECFHMARGRDLTLSSVHAAILISSCVCLAKVKGKRGPLKEKRK